MGNRTAFFVIEYLLWEGVYSDFEDAKKHFEEQRGETMKRDYLSEGLLQILPRLMKESGGNGETGSGSASSSNDRVHKILDGDDDDGHGGGVINENGDNDDNHDDDG